MRALLDVNVLIALLDAEHLHHDQARRWLRENIRTGWATCPITQNGCLRIMAQPGYTNPLSTSQVAERLREATDTAHHEFWPDDISLLPTDVVDWRRLIGPKQLTDVYLLALAVTHGGRFVTFDAWIAPLVVPQAKERNICII